MHFKITNLKVKLIYCVLFVSAPPSSIEIVDHGPNSKIEIRENQEYQLECNVRNSKPAAAIVWYRNNVEYKTGKILYEDYLLYLSRLHLISVADQLRGVEVQTCL